MDGLTPIENQRRDGDFVHATQTMASNDGYRNVSKSWFDKTISYDEGFELLENDVEQREDYLVEMRELRFASEDGKFEVDYNGRKFTPTDHAISQMAANLLDGQGTAFIRYLSNDYEKGKKNITRDGQDADVLRHILQNGKRRIDPTKKMKLRTYSDGTLRAWLSDSYSEVDNRWYLEQVKNIIPVGRLSHWRGDADTIWGNVLISDTIREEFDSEYGGMVSVSNCEIGKRALGSLPSLFRAICMNGCIWGQAYGEKIKVVHRGEIDLDQLKLKLRNNIEKQIKLIPDGIERMLGIRAMGTDGVAMKNIIAATAQKERIDRSGASAILQAWVKDESKIAPVERSLFDVVNSVTRAGQTLTNQRWVDFDKLGGRMLEYSDAQWDSIKTVASNLTDKDLKKVYSSQLVA